MSLVWPPISVSHLSLCHEKDDPSWKYGSGGRECCSNRPVTQPLSFGALLRTLTSFQLGWLDIDKLVEYREPPEDVGLRLKIWNKPRAPQRWCFLLSHLQLYFVRF